MDRDARRAEAPAEPEAETETLLELCSTDEPTPEPSRVDGVAIGVLTGLSATGEPLVRLPWHPPGSCGVVARAATVLSRADAGAEVAALFEGGHPQRPIVVGKLHVAAGAAEATDASAAESIEVEADGEPVVISAERELTLRCGKASITLTRAGKVLIRGEYVLTRSSGTNRIQGGSVQIN